MRKIKFLIGCWMLLNNCFGQGAIEIFSEEKIPVGIEYYFTVVFKDVPDSCLHIIPSVGSISKEAEYRYKWNLSNVDAWKAKITILDTVNNKTLRTKKYRLVRKRVVPRLGMQYGSGTMKNGAFKAQSGIGFQLESYGQWCITEGMEGYTIIRVPKLGSAERYYNKGARFDAMAKSIIDKARPGDLYIFSDFSTKQNFAISEKSLTFFIE